MQDLLTAVRLNTPVAELGHARLSNGERHLRSRDDLAALYPVELLDESVRIAARCRFSLDELRYAYPDDVTPYGMTAHAYLCRLTEQGVARRWPDGCPACRNGTPRMNLACTSGRVPTLPISCVGGCASCAPTNPNAI